VQYLYGFGVIPYDVCSVITGTFLVVYIDGWGPLKHGVLIAVSSGFACLHSGCLLMGGPFINIGP
jgi:hypothetical protein